MQRKMLSRFDQLFVQDAKSQQLLQNIGLAPITTISGDTRFDRVSAIAGQAAAVPVAEQFVAGRPALIAGSTWPEDEELLQQVSQQLSAANLCFVIAPHDIGENRIAAIEKLFPQSIRYSEAVKKNGQPIPDVPVLIIDNIGLLSSIYRYGMACYIGGGFGKGIHNTLEAAVYGKPLLFGPVFHKFKEAKDLIATGAAFSITEPAQAGSLLQQWIQTPESGNRAGMAAQHYVSGNTGATQKILQFIQEKRLLTS